ncbi:MAG TPA: GNAT family N-acetyltransferase [Chloroflexota bacterium]|jgi:CelD/BcsL family acetyltransferase involved in cellulose biosynthesis|nr:GNAT family N-acetyltransferase [Chloroflexota bacterium]
MLILDIHDPRWSAFVEASPQALPFHHPRWASLLGACYGYRPFVLALVDSAGTITAGLPIVEVGGRFRTRRWVSLPFTDVCPPLLAHHSAAGGLLDALMDELAARRVAVCEVRTELVPRARLHTHVAGVRHQLPLTRDASVVAQGFTRMHARNIRKAELSGLQIEHGTSQQAVDTFYRLHLLTRRRLGVPIQPRRFFELLAQEVLVAGLGFVVTVRYGDIPLAAAVFLAWNGVLVYKYGASDTHYWNLRPNHLLFWSAIRWGCEHDYRLLDWGRTDLADRGLRDFKSGWGALESPLAYAVMADQPPSLAPGRLRSAMRLLIRHSSPWVCRTLGEHLYRYAG